ncbi:uncharacterized protein LOC139918670 isoform X2 [Centroberyx gerrardi]|uniref:uncharacterized protein isoform X2 n=1 Tax=Centroberyx gerrardi TaxID=166262 RepID=UPI003AAC8F77
MLSFFFFFCLLTLLTTCSETSSVTRLSVPEQHHLCLSCSDSDSVIWTHRDRRVVATKKGNYETNQNRNKYRLRADGSLCVLQLDESDSGRYCCNDRLRAEVEVLTGHEFMVSAGRTLLLPCRDSSKPKLRWFHKRDGGRREAILTRFKNGTEKLEREENRSRFSLDQDALQILDLQPEDAGEYWCNKEPEDKFIVWTVQPDQTSILPTIITATPTVMKTDVVERKKKEKRPENVLVMIAVVGLGVMILLMALVCVLLTSMKCRRKRKYRRAAAGERQEDTELQPWSSSRQKEPEVPAEESIHYASLGRQNWRERHTRTQPEQNHSVIYSSVITRPAGK